MKLLFLLVGNRTILWICRLKQANGSYVRTIETCRPEPAGLRCEPAIEAGTRLCVWVLLQMQVQRLGWPHLLAALRLVSLLPRLTYHQVPTLARSRLNTASVAIRRGAMRRDVDADQTHRLYKQHYSSTVGGKA